MSLTSTQLLEKHYHIYQPFSSSTNYRSWIHSNFEEETETESKMSWQTYVDEHLLCEIEGNHLISAAIIGQDGTVWAQSANFPQVSFYTHLQFY